MTGAKQAAFAVWQAFGLRDAARIGGVLADDVRWFAPPGNATQVALGLPPIFGDEPPRALVDR